MLLHSKILGTGKPLLILHGFLGMGDNWKTLGRKFAATGYQVHLIDQRNHGRSFHKDAFSYELMAEDLKYYCDHHAIEDLFLMGHSMGGKTAMFFAVAYPEMVTKLIVADIGPQYYHPHHQTILKGLQDLQEDESALSGRTEADTFLAQYISDLGTRQFLLKNLYWETKGRLGLRMNLNALSLSSDHIGAALPLGATFEKPTLFLRGAKSDYITQKDEMGIHAAFAKAEIKTIKNAGHWLHAENPDDFYQEVINFL